MGHQFLIFIYYKVSLDKSGDYMRTRRIIVVLAVIAISITSLFAGSANRQKIYRVDSSEYEDLKYLYIMTGHSLPSTT